ncbi:3D domain-containing protein [Namhaeicola litoreus]|uniref:3D domain-containing protein n=1 Tax=Namhaeicola litoreus TaxID=1052145 RepID=A0ABW3Y001_9FLAO
MKNMRQKTFNRSLITLHFLLVLFLLIGCEKTETVTMEVTASAYNSTKAQTNPDHPTTTAWGDELKPGMKCIAVSRDLIVLGLKHNTEVKISGLPGTYKVLDKMHRKWQKRIDIYMGNDITAARNWGKKKVTISWEKEKK